MRSYGTQGYSAAPVSARGPDPRPAILQPTESTSMVDARQASLLTHLATLTLAKRIQRFEEIRHEFTNDFTLNVARSLIHIDTLEITEQEKVYANWLLRRTTGDE